MIDLAKISQEAFIDELQKIAMSESVITKAINASHNKAMSLLGQSPISASNISAAAKKIRQSSNMRLGLAKRRDNVGYSFLKKGR
jgi:seryl-tRNA(Sec) selenium transferase